MKDPIELHCSLGTGNLLLSSWGVQYLKLKTKCNEILVFCHWNTFIFGNIWRLRNRICFIMKFCCFWLYFKKDQIHYYTLLMKERMLQKQAKKKITRNVLITQSFMKLNFGTSHPNRSMKCRNHFYFFGIRSHLKSTRKKKRCWVMAEKQLKSVTVFIEMCSLPKLLFL